MPASNPTYGKCSDGNLQKTRDSRGRFHLFCLAAVGGGRSHCIAAERFCWFAVNYKYMNEKIIPDHITSKSLSELTDLANELVAKLENKKILLTGCTGFIGKWLMLSFLYYQKLSGCQYTLHVLTRDKERLHQNKYIDFKYN